MTVPNLILNQDTSLRKPRLKRNKPDAYDHAVANMIKRLRMHFCFSLEKVAQAVGLEPEQLEMRENGKVQFTPSELYRLSCYFSLPVEMFFMELEEDIEDLERNIILMALYNSIGVLLFSCRTPKAAFEFAEKMRSTIFKIQQDFETNGCVETGHIAS